MADLSRVAQQAQTDHEKIDFQPLLNHHASSGGLPEMLQPVEGEEKRFDPGHKVDLISSVMADHTIQTSTLTPIDHNEYVQCMHIKHQENDKKGGYSLDRLTVQVIRRFAKPDHSESEPDSVEAKRRERLCCGRCQSALVHRDSETDKASKVKCNFCTEKIRAQKVETSDGDKYRVSCYICPRNEGIHSNKSGQERAFAQSTEACANFYACHNCVKQKFVRSNLEKKTSKHWQQQTYTVDKLNETAAKSFTIMQMEREHSKKAGAKFKAGRFQLKDHTESLEGQEEPEEYAVIGYWTKPTGGTEFECHHQMIVERPLFTYSVNQGVEACHLLHQGEQVDLERFTNEGQKSERRKLGIDEHQKLTIDLEQKCIYYFQQNKNGSVGYREISIDGLRRQARINVSNLPGTDEPDPEFNLFKLGAPPMRKPVTQTQHASNARDFNASISEQLMRYFKPEQNQGKQLQRPTKLGDVLVVRCTYKPADLAFKKNKLEERVGNKLVFIKLNLTTEGQDQNNMHFEPRLWFELPHYSVFLGVNTTDLRYKWTEIWAANRTGISKIVIEKYEAQFQKVTQGVDTLDIDYDRLIPKVHTCYKYSTILEGQTKRNQSPSKKEAVNKQIMTTDGTQEKTEVWEKLESSFRREMEVCFDSDSGVYGQVYDEFRRVVLHFPGHDWFAFSLEKEMRYDFEHKQIPVDEFGAPAISEKVARQNYTAKWFRPHSPMPDAIMAQRKGNLTDMNMVGDLHRTELAGHTSPPGYSLFYIEYYPITTDMREDHQDIVVEKIKGHNYPEAVHNRIYFMMPNQFAYSGNHKFAPYVFADVVMSNGTISGLQAAIVLHYSDLAHQKTRLAMVDAIAVHAGPTEGKGLSDQQKQQILRDRHQVDRITYSPPEQQVSLQYPILVRNSPLPMQNELVVTNCARNLPAKRIIMREFRFIRFVEVSGTLSDQQAHETYIYFLVTKIGSVDKVVQLCRLKADAWPVNDQNKVMQKTNDDIEILDADIRCDYRDKSGAQIPARYFMEKARHIALLHAEDADQRNHMRLAVQFHSDIVLFSIREQVAPRKVPNDDQFKMRQIRMITSPEGDLFYVSESKAGCSVVRVAFDTHDFKKVVENPVYSNRSSLVALQFAHENPYPSDMSFSICALDVENQVIRMQHETVRYQERHAVPKYSIKYQTVSSLAKLTQQLDKVPWQDIVISDRSVSSQKIEQDDNLTRKLESFATYNLASGQISQQAFLDFKADSASLQKQTNREGLHNDCYCMHIFHAPKIGKVVTVMNEGKQRYIRVSQSFDNRRIDLGRYDQPHVGGSEIQIIRDKIFTRSHGQYLVFNERTLLCEKAENYTDLQLMSESPDQDTVYAKITLPQNVQQRKTFGSDQEASALETADNNFRFVDPEQFKRQQERMLTEAGLNLKLVLPVRLDQKGDAVIVGLVSKSLFAKETNKHSVLMLQVDPLDSTRPITKSMLRKNSESQGKTKIYLVEIPDVCSQQTNSLRSVTFFVTKDYLVLKAPYNIYFARLRDIKEQNPDTDLRYELSDLIKIRRERSNLKFDCIDLKRLSNLHYSTEYSLNYLKPSFMRLKKHTGKSQQPTDGPQEKYLQNVIQISLPDITITWNLDQNEEIDYMDKPDQFYNSDTFVQTGIKILPPVGASTNTDPYHERQELFIKSDRLEELNARSKASEDDIPELFKQYTQLDLMEICEIKQRVDDEQLIQTIDLETALCQFFGVTFFAIFMDNEAVLNVVYKQFKEADLQSNMDEQGKETDHILIRRAYYTLELPGYTREDIFNPDWSNEFTFSALYWHYCPVDPQFRRKSLQNLREYQDTCKTPLQHLLDESKDNSRALSAVIRLMLLSSETRLNNLIQDMESFRKVYQASSESINEFMENVFYQNDKTRDITSLPIPLNQTMLVFGAETSQLTPQLIQQQFDQREENSENSWVRKLHVKAKKLYKDLWNRFKSGNDKAMTSTNPIVPVDVRIIDIGFLQQDKDYQNFIAFMSNQRSQDFDTDLAKVILGNRVHTPELVVMGLLPFVVYFLFMIEKLSMQVAHMGHSGDADNNENQIEAGDYEHVWWYWTKELICLFGILYRAGIEMRQACLLWDDYKASFRSTQWVTISSLLINFYLVFALQYRETLWKPKIMAAIGATLMWTQAFYWLPVAQATADIWKMIKQTLRDMARLLFVFFLGIVFFTSLIYIIDKQYESPVLNNDGHCQDGSQDLDCEVYKEWAMAPRLFEDAHWLDSLIYGYMLSIGEYEAVNYADHFDTGTSDYDRQVYWFLFVIFTLFSQITLLNMLIALMSETFSHVYDNQQRYSLQQQTQLVHRYLTILKTPKVLTKNRYLYVIEPRAEGENDLDTGTIQRIRSILGKEMNGLTSKMHKFEAEATHKQRKVQQQLQLQEMQQKQLLLKMNQVSELSALVCDNVDKLRIREP